MKTGLTDYLVAIWYKHKMTCYGDRIHRVLPMWPGKGKGLVYRCARCGCEVDQFSRELIADFYTWYGGDPMPWTVEGRQRQKCYQLLIGQQD